MKLIISFFFFVSISQLCFSQIQAKKTDISTKVVTALGNSVKESDCSFPCTFSTRSIGYLKIDDIKGESTASGHEDEIDVYGMTWIVYQSELATVGSGRRRGRAEVSDLKIMKYVDSSSPYLIDSSLRSKSFDEVVIELKQTSGGGNSIYYTYTLQNVIISGFETITNPNGRPMETISLNFEKIKVKYQEFNQDGSMGDEHEIEYDIAAGA